MSISEKRVRYLSVSEGIEEETGKDVSLSRECFI